MIIISHRANLNGIDDSTENKPSQIEKCILMGYDVEIDLRYNNKKLYLGHDFPQYEISIDFLSTYKDNLWIHCKDAESLFYMTEISKDIPFNYFFHDRDKFTVTSKGIIWCYPKEPYNENCIILMPEWYTDVSKFDTLKNYNALGICTDYPILLI